MSKRLPRMMELRHLRVHYDRAELRREDLAPDPFRQFTVWMNDACEAGLVEPNAMSLATSSPDGKTSLRTVLLKAFDARGFVFYTNLESRKARQIADNPHVSLLFAWLSLHRQVAISGRAERVSTAESLAYFASRPIGSQLGAWVSPQSRVISTRALLEMKWEELKRKFKSGEVPMPSFWGGFRVVPEEIEFWQGRGNRLHDRFQYRRTPEGHWTLERLAP